MASRISLLRSATALGIRRAPTLHLPSRTFARSNSSSSSSSSSKAPNPTSQFYKTFTRPVAKVILMAVLTYQLLYWSWAKLETDEIREERDATIANLEGKVEEYKKKIADEAKDVKSSK